jgi:hypothetical protein
MSESRETPVPGRRAISSRRHKRLLTAVDVS